MSANTCLCNKTLVVEKDRRTFVFTPRRYIAVWSHANHGWIQAANLRLRIIEPCACGRTRPFESITWTPRLGAIIVASESVRSNCDVYECRLPLLLQCLRLLLPSTFILSQKVMLPQRDTPKEHATRLLNARTNHNAEAHVARRSLVETDVHAFAKQDATRCNDFSCT